MVAVRLLASLLAAFSTIPKALCATLPHGPRAELDFSSIFDPSTFNQTFFEPGSSVIDDLLNDPEIPFTETPVDGSGEAGHNNLERRASKRYNYLRYKVTLTGYINNVWSTADFGNPVRFKVTSADVYVFDKIRNNAKDIIIKWRNPNGGQALPGCIYWMTNKRLYKFLAPGGKPEPTYTDTVPTVLENQNQLIALELYGAGKDYNRWNQFSARYFFAVGWGLPDGIRNGGARFKFATTGTKQINGFIYVQSLGYPFRHSYYYATISGALYQKSYAYL
ncbi:hypothetical protein TWF718_008504 [Orbilia javanica]|uniref:Uncharacterized protein n=1 Tax=Orbilia javanica TaxID=47235 RepID=A0AAN8MQD6_9PEZI